VPLVDHQGRGFIVGLRRVGDRLLRGPDPDFPCQFVPLRPPGGADRTAIGDP
jgi:hypothetical protein